MYDPVDRVLAEWLAFLRVERGASPHTLSNYRRDAERWVEFLRSRGVRDLAEVSEHMVVDHLEALSSGALTGHAAAPSSVARALAAIRGLHRFALREGLVPSDPTAGVHPPRAPERLPKALTVDEVAALIGACAGDDPTSLRDRALVEVLYATGARVSEVVRLAVDDLDLEAPVPVLRLFGKGRKERLVPVGSYAMAALEAWLVRGRPTFAAAGRGCPEVFLNHLGRPLSRQSAWQVVMRRAEAAGIAAHVGPHTLRHSFATHLLEGGASVRDVQELLGHASVATTQIYTRVTAATLREVHRQAHPRALG